MKVSVVIPTLNAESNIGALLTGLFSQTQKSEIIVIDSLSDDRTKEIVSSFKGVKLMTVERSEFDHGRTRDTALKEAKGDFIVFLTQDVTIEDADCLKKLLDPFKDEKTAAVYGRQIPYEDAPSYEKLIREFNYPNKSHVFKEEDIKLYGTRAYFFSDVFAAYRREAYEKCGGFDHPVETNEDMLLCAKLLHAGYAVAYNAEAVVRHSHRFTLKEEYERYKKIGSVLERYKDRLYGASDNSEAFRLVSHVLKGLLKQGSILAIPVFLTHATARFFGNRAGRRSAAKTVEK